MSDVVVRHLCQHLKVHDNVTSARIIGLATVAVVCYAVILQLQRRVIMFGLGSGAYTPSGMHHKTPMIHH